MTDPHLTMNSPQGHDNLPPHPHTVSMTGSLSQVPAVLVILEQLSFS